MEIDSEYLEVARYEMFVTMLLCLIYSALHLPQYLERVLPHLTPQMHENGKCRYIEGETEMYRRIGEGGEEDGVGETGRERGRGEIERGRGKEMKS